MALTLRWLTGRTGPPLRHGRVLLVVPQPSHYEAWSLLRETSRHHLEPYEPAWAADELSRPAFRRRLRRYRADRRWGLGEACFVMRQSDGALLGGVTLTNVRRGVTQSASIGYWIGLPYIRQGFATDAVAAMLRHAFDDLALNRVEAACMPANRASLAVLQRAGFRHEGLARRYLKINGAFEDHVLFARLRDDPDTGARPASGTAEAPSPRFNPAPLRANGGQQPSPETTAHVGSAPAAEGHAA